MKDFFINRNKALYFYCLIFLLFVKRSSEKLYLVQTQPFSNEISVTWNLSEGDYSLDNSKLIQEESDVKAQPLVRYQQADPNKIYAIIVASVEGEDGERVQTPHWIVVDVPGFDFRRGNLQNGKTLVPYDPPSSSTGKEGKKLIFLVFDQNGNSAKMSNIDKKSFRNLDFLKENNFQNIPAVSKIISIS